MTVTFTKEVTIKTASDDYKDPRIEGIKVLVVVVSTWFEGTTAAGLSIEDLTEPIQGYVVLLRNTYGKDSVTVVGAGYDAAKAEELTPGRTPKLRRKAVSIEEIERERRGLEVRKHEAGVSEYDYEERTSLTWEEVLGLLNLEKEAKKAYDQIHFVGHGDRPKEEGEGRIPGGMIFQTHFGHQPPVVKRKDEKWEGDLGPLSERKNWPVVEGGAKGYVGEVKIVLAACFSCSGNMKTLFESAVGAGNVHCTAGEIRFGVPEKDAKGNIIMKDWYEYDDTIQDIARFLGILEE